MGNVFLKFTLTFKVLKTPSNTMELNKYKKYSQYYIASIYRVLNTDYEQLSKHSHRLRAREELLKPNSIDALVKSASKALYAFCNCALRFFTAW